MLSDLNSQEFKKGDNVRIYYNAHYYLSGKIINIYPPEAEVKVQKTLGKYEIILIDLDKLVPENAPNWIAKPINPTSILFNQKDSIEGQTPKTVPPSILSEEKNSIEAPGAELTPPSILFREKDSIEGQTPKTIPKRNYETGTITTYRKYQQDYFRFSYYSVDKRKHHIHLGNINNPKAIQITKMIRQKQNYKTPLKEIIKFINAAKNNLC